MIICEKCNKRMPTKNILDLHMVKRHGGASPTAETVIKPVEKPVEQVDQTVSTKEVVEGMVEIHSVDGRELEVSVGHDTWKGKTITVPVEMEEEVRRLLVSGNFFIR